MRRLCFELSRTQAACVVVGLTVLAFSLSLHQIGRRSLWFDEAYSVHTAMHWDALGQFAVEPNMWLYYATLHSWIQLGTSEGTLRALSAVYAAACVPVIYRLGCELFDRRVALVGAALLSVSAYLVRYGQELRAYSLMILLCGLSSLNFVRVIRGRARYAWAAYGLFSGIAPYAHYFAALTTGAQVVSVLFLPSRQVPWRQLCGAFAVALLVAIPMLVSFRPGAGNLDWVDPPRISHLVGTLKGLAGGGWLLACYGLAMLAVAYSPWAIQQRADSSHADSLYRWRLAFLVLWCVGPLLLIFVVSLTWRPMYVDRYFSPSLMPLLLMAAAGVARVPRQVRLAVLVVLILLNAKSLSYWYREPESFNYRDAVAAIMQRSQPGDALGIYNYFITMPVRYYSDRFGGGRPMPVLVNLASAPFDEGSASNMPEPDTRMITHLPDHYDRFWLLISMDEPERRETIMHLLSGAYQLRDQWEFGEVRLFLYDRLP